MKEEKLKELLEDMTLKEKVNQMFQVSGSLYSEDSVLTGPMKENGFTEENLALAGSVIGVQDAAAMWKIQEKYIKQHPHGIPLLFMLDVINGYRTVFPIPLGQGAAFRPDLTRRCAEAAAREASASGIHVTFAPMADLVRDARWGRVMESTGEDPYLNGLFCQAMVRGFQGEDVGERGRLAACVKHFAAYGAPVAGRDYNTVELSEHTLREFYLPAYRKGIEAGAELVMTSFNTINGIPATGNKFLMRQVLRKEFGFDGVLISDWTAIEELIAHGYCEDRKDAAYKAVRAGVDIDMMSGIYPEFLVRLVEDGEVPLEMVDHAVWRILRLKNRLGLFENPFKDAGQAEEKKFFLCPEHRLLAREAAAKSFVLLKNEGVLPLHPEDKTVWIGPYLDTREMIGSWSFTGDKSAVSTIREVLPEYAVHTEGCQGCPILEPETDFRGLSDAGKHLFCQKEQEQLMQEAERYARSAETVVLFLGEHSMQSGEASSRTQPVVPEIQMELFRRISRINSNLVVVLFSGRPLEVREISRKAKAVLEVWLPGTEGARAILETLMGKRAPEGKLSMSFPWDVGQVPVYYNEDSTGRPDLEEAKEDRFRSRYLDAPNGALYPFGYGLTYTQFQISPVRLNGSVLRPGESLKAVVALENTGNCEGTETLQLYIRDVSASVVRPVKELRDFRKVTLRSGESKEVTFEIREEQLRFWRADGTFGSEKGRFQVFIGQDSGVRDYATFELL